MGGGRVGRCRRPGGFRRRRGLPGRRLVVPGPCRRRGLRGLVLWGLVLRRSRRRGSRCGLLHAIVVDQRRQGQGHRLLDRHHLHLLASNRNLLHQAVGTAERILVKQPIGCQCRKCRPGLNPHVCHCLRPGQHQPLPPQRRVPAPLQGLVLPGNKPGHDIAQDHPAHRRFRLQPVRGILHLPWQAATPCPASRPAPFRSGWRLIFLARGAWPALAASPLAVSFLGACFRRGGLPGDRKSVV